MKKQRPSGMFKPVPSRNIFDRPKSDKMKQREKEVRIRKQRELEGNIRDIGHCLDELMEVGDETPFTEMHKKFNGDHYTHLFAYPNINYLEEIMKKYLKEGIKYNNKVFSLNEKEGKTKLWIRCEQA